MPTPRWRGLQACFVIEAQTREYQPRGRITSLRRRGTLEASRPRHPALRPTQPSIPPPTLGHAPTAELTPRTKTSGRAVPLPTEDTAQTLQGDSAADVAAAVQAANAQTMRSGRAPTAQSTRV